MYTATFDIQTAEAFWRDTSTIQSVRESSGKHQLFAKLKDTLAAKFGIITFSEFEDFVNTYINSSVSVINEADFEDVTSTTASSITSVNIQHTK